MCGTGRVYLFARGLATSHPAMERAAHAPARSAMTDVEEPVLVDTFVQTHDDDAATGDTLAAATATHAASSRGGHTGEVAGDVAGDVAGNTRAANFDPHTSGNHANGQTVPRLQTSLPNQAAEGQFPEAMLDAGMDALVAHMNSVTLRCQAGTANALNLVSLANVIHDVLECAGYPDYVAVMKNLTPDLHQSLLPLGRPLRLREPPRGAAEGLAARASQDATERHSHNSAEESSPFRRTDPVASPLYLPPVRSDGFIEEECQEDFVDWFGNLRDAAVQGYLDFYRACFLGKMFDALLESVQKPRRWKLLAPDEHPQRGYVLISQRAASYVITKSQTAAKQAYLGVVTVEAVDGFCEVLRAVMQPAVEEFRRGTLQLVDRLPEQTVALLSSDQRAALSTALHNVVPLAYSDELTREAFNDFCAVVAGALESAGRRAQPIAPYQASTDADEHMRRHRAQPVHGEDIIQEFEAGTLPFAVLEGYIRHLNGIVYRGAPKLP